MTFKKITYTKKQLEDMLEDLLTNAVDPMVIGALIDAGYKIETFIDEDDADLRIRIAEKAGELNRRDILKALVDDDDEDVRHEVAISAGLLGYKSLLKELATDGVGQVRNEALYQQEQLQ